MKTADYPMRLNVALFFAVASYSTLQSIIIPVLPLIAERYDAQPQDAAWLVSGFLAVGAAVTPVAGRLGDLFGHVKVLILVLLIFMLGALLAVLSTTILMLIVARMIQGLGAAAVSLSLSIIKSRYPPKRAGGAVGMISATMAAAAGTGLSLSGLVTTYLGLSAIFLLPLAVSVTSILLLLPQRKMDRARVDGARDVNWWGGPLFAAGMFLVLLGITQGSTWGWFSLPTLVAFLGGAGVMAGWVASELRARTPLIDVRLLASPRLIRINLATLLVGGVMFSTYTLMPVFLEARTPDGYGLGLSAAVAGLIMLPVSVMNFMGGSFAGPITAAIGSRNMLVLGASINAGSLLFVAFLHDHPVQLLITLALHGAAVGLAFASMPALTMQAVHSDYVGVAAGIYNTLRSAGGAIGTQIAFAILATGGGEPTGSTFLAVLVFLGIIGGASLIAALAIPRTHPDESEAT